MNIKLELRDECIAKNYIIRLRNKQRYVKIEMKYGKQIEMEEQTEERMTYI